MKTYRVLFTTAADKEIDSLPKVAVESVMSAIRALADNPRPRGCRKIVGKKNTYRIRVGDYRVIHEVHDKEVVVLVIRVAHRKQAYRY